MVPTGSFTKMGNSGGWTIVAAVSKPASKVRAPEAAHRVGDRPTSYLEY